MSGNFDLYFAGQLHGINELSATLATTIEAHDVLTTLAASVRAIFDADDAVVRLDSGPHAPLQAIASRSTAEVTSSPVDLLPVHFSAPGNATGAWRHGDWLGVPLRESVDGSRGMVAVRFQSSGERDTAEEELLTLIANIASRTLEGAELRRVIGSSESRLRALVESAPVSIIESDSADRVLWRNASAAALLDWRDRGAHDQTTPALPERMRSHLAPLWREITDQSTTAERDIGPVEIGEHTRSYHVAATLLPSARPGDRRIWTFIYEMESPGSEERDGRAAQELELRGQVASTVAHDFNNLLTLISGYAEILLQDLGNDDRAFQMVQDIKSTASRASLLTGQMQTIGRLKPADPVLLNPETTMRMNAEVLQRIVGVDIEVRWSFDDRPCFIHVDADQFEQMILNLTLNARDAMPLGGTLSISVDAVTIESDEVTPPLHVGGDYVLISVADTGVGMDRETQFRCFEPYFTTKGPLQGSGLGLSAARRLVEESGGAIICSSQLGAGCIFQIFFPAVNGADAQPNVPTDSVRPQGSARVLLAEDDDALRRLMGQALVRNGFRVLEAATGERALELARNFDGTIDILVSDVVIPDVSGRELALTLRAADNNLRVLLVSGVVDAQVLVGLPHESSSFLAKPFRPSELIREVHALLARVEPRTVVV